MDVFVSFYLMYADNARVAYQTRHISGVSRSLEEIMSGKKDWAKPTESESFYWHQRLVAVRHDKLGREIEHIEKWIV